MRFNFFFLSYLQDLTKILKIPLMMMIYFFLSDSFCHFGANLSLIKMEVLLTSSPRFAICLKILSMFALNNRKSWFLTTALIYNWVLRKSFMNYRIDPQDFPNLFTRLVDWGSLQPVVFLSIQARHQIFSFIDWL